MKNKLWEACGKNFYTKIRESFADYTVSLIAIVITSVYAAFVFVMTNEYDVAFLDEPVFSVVGRGLTYFCFGAVFAETYFAGRKKGKICALIAAAAIAVLAALGTDLDAAPVPAALETGLVANKQIFGISGGALAELTERFLYGYLLLLVLGTVYFCYKKSGIGFSEYVLKVFSNMMKVFIVFWILTFGVLLITGIVDTLLLDGYSYYDACCEILIFGLYLVPMCLSALRDMTNEPGAFLRTIVKYILVILSACGMAIVYLYVIKIICLWKMPSNEVFSIVSALFCLGMPVWMMAEYYAEDSRYYKVFSKLPYLFAPLMILQIYSMVVRIGQYGVTPGRYMGMMLVIFETVSLFIWHFRKKKREEMLSFLSLLIVIAVFVPGINMYSVSNLCQQSFLKNYYQDVLDGRELSGLEYERMSGAYKYLKRQAQTEEFAGQYDITEKSFAEKLKEMDIKDSSLTNYDNHQIHCCKMVETLDLGDYRNLYMLDQADCYNERSEAAFQAFYPDQNGEKITIFYGSGFSIDFSAFQFVKRATGEIITIDISDFAWKCMLYEQEHPHAETEVMSDAMREYNCIQIDENTVLYLNHFQIRYSEGVQYGELYFEMGKPTISGILLTKE